MALLAAMAGCNQSTGADLQAGGQGPSVAPAQGTPAAPGEGQKLEGAQLSAFLEKSAKQPALPAPSVKIEPGADALAKTADQSCMVNFDNALGLSNMADHAYVVYATSPYYFQYCPNHYNAYVAPINHSYYYLPPEVLNCSGAYRMMGTPGQFGSCLNQQDAALVPRHAGNGTTTDSDLGLQFYMQRDGVNKSFDLKSLRILQGTINVFVYRNGIGWWYWTLPAGSWSFPAQANNVAQMQIFNQTSPGEYVVDDVLLNGLP